MWKIALIALLVICALFLIILGMFFWRLRAIGSRVGSFECALFENGRWRAGVATYSQSYLNWHKILSLAATPNRQFSRREFEIIGRQVSGSGGPREVADARCIHQGEPVQISAESGALDGLVSWLEASPPNSHR